MGANVALMAQLADAASVAPQVVLSAKLLAFVPPSKMLPILSVAFPVLVRVTPEDALVVATLVVGKLMLVADNEATGANPVPESATVCGDPEALSLTDSVALSVPLAVGVKFTGMVQFALAASVVLHVVV